MGHNRVASRGHGQLQDEFVARISQRWSPQKVNLLTMGSMAEVVDEALSVGALQIQLSGVANQYDLVFQSQRYGHGDFESFRAQKLQQPE
ncbi:MAG: hypothetical protein A3H29_02730 [Acidobacteria bacterium RIFCSPLOWO2_02_FULL_67_21]|nr:MAG: hypothetical protein A3H29_02730 [Acidobacteria bacterium RIFCSPLOWO2_02_FULL_67_21]